MTLGSFLAVTFHHLSGGRTGWTNLSRIQQVSKFLKGRPTLGEAPADIVELIYTHPYAREVIDRKTQVISLEHIPDFARTHHLPLTPSITPSLTPQPPPSPSLPSHESVGTSAHQRIQLWAAGAIIDQLNKEFDNLMEEVKSEAPHLRFRREELGEWSISSQQARLQRVTPLWWSIVTSFAVNRNKRDAVANASNPNVLPTPAAERASSSRNQAIQPSNFKTDPWLVSFCLA